LARKGLPIAALKTKADDFILAGSLTKNQAEVMVRNIEAERGKQRIINDPADGEADADDRGRLSEQLTRAEMQKELDDRVEKMRAGAAGGGITDQYRVARGTDRLCSRRAAMASWTLHGVACTCAHLLPRSLNTLSVSWKPIATCVSWCRLQCVP